MTSQLHILHWLLSQISQENGSNHFWLEITQTKSIFVPYILRPVVASSGIKFALNGHLPFTTIFR